MSNRAQIHNRSNPSQLADMLEAIDRGQFKMLALPESAIVGLFNVAHSKPGYLMVPGFDALPEGYFVDACFPDYSRRSLLFRVFHPSFPSVDERQIGAVEIGDIHSIAVKLGTY